MCGRYSQTRSELAKRFGLALSGAALPEAQGELPLDGPR